MLILPLEVALLELTSRILLCDCVREALISRTVTSAITFQPAVDTWTGVSDNVYVTNSLHSMGQSPSWEAPQLVGKFLAFYETRRFITEFKQSVTFPYPHPEEPSPNPVIPCLQGTRTWTTSTLQSSKMSPFFRYPYQSPACVVLLSHACRIPRPSHALWL